MSTTDETVSCPACGAVEGIELGCRDRLPVAVTELSRTRAEALERPRARLDLRCCATCGHVFRARPEPGPTPCPALPGRAHRTAGFWNRGRLWRRWQDDLVRDWTDRLSLVGERVVEVEPGDGSFGRRLERAGCRWVGFEPDGALPRARARGLDVRSGALTRAAIESLRPAAIVCRHVLAELAEPEAFLREVRRGAIEAGISPHLLAEVQRGDQTLARRRVNDLCGASVSSFTEHSLRVLFERTGWGVVETRAGFGGEVLTLVAVPRRRSGPRSSALDRAVVARTAHDLTESFEPRARGIAETVARWRSSGSRVALWGAGGRAAALINLYGLDPEIAPLVVDADPAKQGAFVPGTGQRVESPEACRRASVDRILIGTQWRARDIEHEIRRVRGLACEVWVPVDGRVVPLRRRLEA